MADTRPDDLEAWFAAARERPPLPDAAFLARLSADAAGAAPSAGGAVGMAAARPPARAVAGRSPPRRRGAARLVAGLGGWRGISGLVAAGLAGLWIGLVLPDSVRRIAPAAGTDETLDLFAAADGYFGEG